MKLEIKDRKLFLDDERCRWQDIIGAIMHPQEKEFLEKISFRGRKRIDIVKEKNRYNLFISGKKCLWKELRQEKGSFKEISGTRKKDSDMENFSLLCHKLFR